MTDIEPASTPGSAPASTPAAGSEGGTASQQTRDVQGTAGVISARPQHKPRRRLFFVIALWILAVASAGYLVSFKLGVLSESELVFALLACTLLAGLCVEAVLVIISGIRGGLKSIAGISRVFIVVGGLAVCGGGTANWLLSLQGWMILYEGEVRALFGGHGLEDFRAGPWAKPSEMGVTVQLVEVKIEPGASGLSLPISTVRVRQERHLNMASDASPQERPDVISHEVARSRSVRAGKFWLHQGAFGYAPRLVLLQGEKTLYDEQVPLVTERREGRGVVYEREVEIPDTTIKIVATVRLDSLDEKGRGHPELQVRVMKDDSMVGEGRLKPGHFATTEGGYRVGFAGMKKWAEIDVSRRTYSEPMTYGMGGFVLGLFGWVVAMIRRMVRGG